LDVHTTSSEFLGYDQNGHPQFDTIRSPLGELLYQLKYRGQQTAPQVAEVLAEFFADKPNALSRIDVIVPMPASTLRNIQPVAEVAMALGRKLNKQVDVAAVTKVRETPGLKNIQDAEERRELLDGAFQAETSRVTGKGILLLDDLYRSGATANAVTLSLVTAGAARVYFLAMTRTRSNL
jgi:predicted amidophosphoribosyltransferase